jgi:hypothetical protein
MIESLGSQPAAALHSRSATLAAALQALGEGIERVGDQQTQAYIRSPVKTGFSLSRSRSLPDRILLEEHGAAGGGHT